MSKTVKLTRQGVRDLGNPNPQRGPRAVMPRCPDVAHIWIDPKDTGPFGLLWRWKCLTCPATCITDAGDSP